MKKVFGILLVIFGAGILLAVSYMNSKFRNTTRVFSTRTLLLTSWDDYKKAYINDDGRVVDHSQEGITTSEGESYAMLRAVWTDDKSMFDTIWKFTQNNLKRPKDALFGWRWGKDAQGNYAFSPGGGGNSASDADSDIALALILANRRWGDWKYEDDAKKILDDMWKLETAEAAGRRYLTAGNWAADQKQIVVNPSYFAPYAWRIFATVDMKHDWMSLIDPAYELLKKSGQEKLDRQQAVGLPPDWIAIDRATGQLIPVNKEGLTTNYAYDAMRVPWRISLDWRWNKEEKAREYLQSLQFLGNEWKEKGRLEAGYYHDGSPLSVGEQPTMYSTALGYFMAVDPNEGDKVYQDKIVKLYSNEENNFRKDLPYYEQNWLWFGAALYKDFLSDFSKGGGQ